MNCQSASVDAFEDSLANKLQNKSHQKKIYIGGNIKLGDKLSHNRTLKTCFDTVPAKCYEYSSTWVDRAQNLYKVINKHV